MQPSNEIATAVQELSERSGFQFQVSPEPVPNTNLYVVHTANHPFRPEYTINAGVFGFRVPFNFPDAAPEDSCFIAPVETKLILADPVRHSIDLNRCGVAQGYVAGSLLGAMPVLIFSWHLWDRTQWNRRKHTLLDHYAHCIRRFELPEHD